MQKADKDALEAARNDSETLQDDDRAQGAGKKKRKPKKKAKHLPLLPSVLAVQEQLAWKLEQTAKLGRHAVANESIAAGANLLCRYHMVVLNTSILLQVCPAQ